LLTESFKGRLRLDEMGEICGASCLAAIVRSFCPCGQECVRVPDYRLPQPPV
jgi:hypothetical protein